MPGHALARLASGLAALGIDMPPARQARLLAYRDLLLKWNRAYNLTAITDPEAAITHHLLDSLSILPWVSGPFLDAGSGGGLPGIPLAIARPEFSVTLVDAVQKKVSFQRQAVIELGLSNVHALHSRLEEHTGQYDQIVSRAFASLAGFAVATRHLLAPEGCWLAMKGQRPDAELAALPFGIEMVAVEPLAVPGLDAKRYLIMMKAGS